MSILELPFVLCEIKSSVLEMALAQREGLVDIVHKSGTARTYV